MKTDLGNVLKEFQENLQSKEGNTNFPPSYWINVTNVFGDGSTVIGFTQGGNLWVFYEYGNEPASQIYVWHQGGSVTPVSLGENNIAVGPGDCLVYQLTNPATDSIKIGYQLT